MLYHDNLEEPVVLGLETEVRWGRERKTDSEITQEMSSEKVSGYSAVLVETVMK